MEFLRALRDQLRSFKSLPVAEKRKLVVANFQDIQVKAGSVISLCLLTGKAADLVQQQEERQQRAAMIEKNRRKMDREFQQANGLIPRVILRRLEFLV